MTRPGVEGSADGHVVMAVSVDVEDCQGGAEVGTQLGARQVAQLKQALTSQENNLEKKERTNGQLLEIESVDVMCHLLKLAKVLLMFSSFVFEAIGNTHTSLMVFSVSYSLHMIITKWLFVVVRG